MADLSDAVMLCEVCRDAHKIGECPGLPMSFDAWWSGTGFVVSPQSHLLKGWCRVAWEAGQDAKAEEHPQWLKAVTTRRVDPCVAAYDRSPTETPTREDLRESMRYFEENPESDEDATERIAKALADDCDGIPLKEPAQE